MAYTKSQVQVGGVLAVAAVGGIAVALKLGKLVKGKLAAKKAKAQVTKEQAKEMQADAMEQAVDAAQAMQDKVLAQTTVVAEKAVAEQPVGDKAGAVG